MSSKRKSRASESAADTPNSKRRKAAEVETSQKTQSIGYQLLSQLRAAKDKRNNLICTEFETLPEQEDVPDYYDIIKLPIAFDTIEDKLDRLKYPTLTTLECDFKRLVVNAKTYNEKDSEIHADAERIRKHVATFMTKNNPAYNDPDYVPFPTPIPDEDETAPELASKKPDTKNSQASEEKEHKETIKAEEKTNSTGRTRDRRSLTLNRPRSPSATAPENSASQSGEADPPSGAFQGKTFQEAQEIILDELLDFTNEEGVEISGPFENLPSRDLRDYYQVVKYPVSLKGVQRKVRGTQGRGKATGQTVFKSWQAFADELAFIWNNARLYNEEGSEIYDAAGELEGHFNTRLEEAKALVQEPVQPKVTLRVAAKESEPAPRVKLNVASRAGRSASHATDPEASKGQQDVAATGPLSDARSSSRAVEETVPSEAKSDATPTVPTPNGIKAETAASQSPTVPSDVPPARPASAEKAPASADGSQPQENTLAMKDASPAPSLPRAPPPPPPRDPLEARLRPTGKSAEDALISSFVLSTPSTPKTNQKFRLTVPPSEKLSQQSVSVTLPESQRHLRVATSFPSFLFQRPHRIILRLNKESLQPIPIRSEDGDSQIRAFDISLSPGMVNILDLEVLVSLTPRGAPKIGNSSEYDYERVTVYLNVFG